jgi:hypothetical protein
MMQASKKIPFDDPNVLLGVRVLYVVSNLIIFGIYFYVGMQIDKKKGTTCAIHVNTWLWQLLTHAL